MIIDKVAKYGGSKRLISILSSTSIKRLYPPQVLSIKAGLLKRHDSFVVAAPTASGKTLVAEIAALQTIEKNGKVIYLVPLRALAREKYDDFFNRYKGAGIKVMQSTGDYDKADPRLYNADIIISTNEKVDSLLRHRASWLRDVSLVVADEIHLIGDHHRGPTLEIVLTRLSWMNPKLRFIALSATIPNAADISRWLNAALVESEWRPVPLREGVFFNDATIFNDGTVKWIERLSSIDEINLALETIKATRFGHRVSDLYIDPMTGVVIRDCLNQPQGKGTFSLLHMIASTPDMMSLPLRKKDIEEMLDVFYVHLDELLIPVEKRYPSE